MPKKYCPITVVTRSLIIYLSMEHRQHLHKSNAEFVFISEPPASMHRRYLSWLIQT
jgi:hypothetical protein